jgi:endonuclease YncB( thermonuclease family)
MKTLATLLLLATACSLTLSAVADTLEGRIVSIADGDTVTILDAANKQTKIRLMGIDAPEKAQAFGTRSKQALSDLVFNKQVTVEFNKQDKYGRTIGKILVDGLDANLEQVKAGMAWHYKLYAKEQATSDLAVYTEAETQARADKRGLWGDREQIPPWEWRHK